MRRIVTLLTVMSLVLASAAAVAAARGVPFEEVLSGNVAALWSPVTTETTDQAATAGGGADPASVAASAPGAAVAAEATTTAQGHLPENDRARGLIYDGLTPGAPDGVCPGGFEIAVAGETLCTHGPDPAQAGIDVTKGRSTAQLRLDTLSLPTVPDPTGAGRTPPGNGASNSHVHADGSIHDHSAQAAAEEGSRTAAEAGIVPVVGDGVSGNRVQAVYAVASDRADRYDEVAPLIANWAAHMDAKVNESAALTGGERHVRYVTDGSGSLDVAKLILPAEGDDNFGSTIQALKAAGFNDPSRKYLVWTDASLYCGVATIYGDDSPDQDNANNGRYPMYSRVDTGCWGHNSSAELHEVVHNMGAVQQSAPHVTPGWHCTDDYDRMCYRDSASVTMTQTCPTWMEELLDCGHDDYFHVSPPSGSYLASHWNVADSAFLHDGPVGGTIPPPPPPPDQEAPIVEVAGPSAVTLPDDASLDGTVTDDGLPGPYTVAWSTVSGPDDASFADPGAEDTTASFPAAGDYVLRLTADDGELTGYAEIVITVIDETQPPNEAPQVAASAPSSVTLPDAAALNGTVSDDGLPGPYTVAWSTISGPGAVSFADVTAEDTMATFPAAGEYVLRLTADDGEMTSAAEVTVTVSDPGPTEVTESYSDSLNRRWTSRGYEIVAAEGPIGAVLTFEVKGKGKKAETADLTLNLYDGSGNLLDSLTGASPVELSAEVVAGVYIWEVTAGSTNYTLDLTYLGH
jgi:hypothetical protein